MKTRGETEGEINNTIPAYLPSVQRSKLYLSKVELINQALRNFHGGTSSFCQYSTVQYSPLDGQEFAT
jgi:hypothetical protein